MGAFGNLGLHTPPLNPPSKEHPNHVLPHLTQDAGSQACRMVVVASERRPAEVPHDLPGRLDNKLTRQPQKAPRNPKPQTPSPKAQTLNPSGAPCMKTSAVWGRVGGVTLSYGNTTKTLAFEAEVLSICALQAWGPVQVRYPSLSSALCQPPYVSPQEVC